MPMLRLLLLGTLLSGCSFASLEGDASGAIDRADVVGGWTIDQSASTDEIDVYRRSDTFKPPASRFTMAYVFRADGTCDWMFLAPDDGHHFKPGTWQLVGDTLHVQQDVPVVYQAHLRDDALVLQRLTDGS